MTASPQARPRRADIPIGGRLAVPGLDWAAGLDSGAEGRDDWEKARGCTAMPVQQLTRRFTVEEYYRMAQAGILSEDDRVELIEGAIVEMAAIGSRHAACVGRLTVLSSTAQTGGIVWVQNPIRLGEHSVPQPDLALLRLRPDFYASAHPGPGDVFLLVEVSETSADSDREVKVPIYARAGIPEVWLVDLEGEVIEVYRQPSAEGYRDARQVRRGEALSPEAFPDLTLAADEILG